MIVTSLIGVSAEFSSPSGDGLVQVQCEIQFQMVQFSSPSGDGLVLFCGVLFFSFFRRFSSPLGDGLVQQIHFVNLIKKQFSSPLGVGLVLSLIPSDCDRYIIFVPEWGWVGSVLDFLLVSTRSKFSSPLGDGLVLEWYDRNKFVCEFSSPLGDGLVLMSAYTKASTTLIFVPEWGWVGSKSYLRIAR